MHAGATLFLDVCVQLDTWPDGVWPLVTRQEAQNVARLFSLAGELAIRQAGVICRHEGLDVGVAGAPEHGRDLGRAADRPAGCTPFLPMQVWDDHAAIQEHRVLDRTHAVYVDSGCGVPPDRAPGHQRAFDHLAAGIRDAVVFGGGIEYGLDLAVDALLRRRIRTHVALDACGRVDAVGAQVVVARWKRRAVDGATVATIHRLLTVR